ncbi:transcriptional regulator family: Fungal Specific TF [Aspergillus niger]|nr:transcriptional regulator family: Fungal Specific TF [Aspergillus niger]
MSASGVPFKHLNACNKCAARKVKCDKKEPCGACHRAGAECIYPTIVHRPRKRKFQSSLDVLMEKLGEYEDLLRRNNIPFTPLPANDVEAVTSNIEASASAGSRSSPLGHVGPLNAQDTDRQSLSDVQGPASNDAITIGGLVVNDDGSKNYEYSMLATLSKEFTPNTPQAESTSTSSVRSLICRMLLSPIGPSQSSSLVIPASHEEELWSIFLRDVDPLTKVIHWPVVDQLRKRKISAKPTPTCFDALLASIYACAIVPLGEVECQTRFGHGRAVLIEHYYAATRKALFELDFLHSLDLMLVQALALLLTSIHHLSEPSLCWSILGLVIRKAQTIGLHRDGTSLGLSLYECEIRRRVWWYLVTLDMRVSELSGAANSIISQPWDTNFPTNINDQDLHPDIDFLTPATDGLTDMSFCLFQYEAVRLVRSAYLAASPEVMLRNSPRMLLSIEQINVFRRTVEDRFLRFCDPVIPVHFMLNSFARLTLSKMQAFVQEIRPKERKPQQSSRSDSGSKLNYGLRMLEYDQLLHSNPSVHGFRWFIYVQFPWGALIWLLQSMLTKDWGAREDNTWHHIETLYQRYPELYDEDRGLHRLVNTLVLRVWWLRQALRKGPALPSEVEPTPLFITELLSKPYIRNDQVAPVESREIISNEGTYGAAPITSEATIMEQLDNWDQLLFMPTASPESNFDFSAWLT